MPKAFGRDIPNWMLIGAAACAVMLAYKQFAGGSDEPAASTKRKAPAKLASASDLYTKEDFAATTATFASYKEPARNAFLPLVHSASAHGVPGANGLTSEITGGEANWFYTGNIEVNGRAQALLENTVTGESVYLSRGDKFKNNATVVDITPDQVVFSAPTGRVVAKLNDPTELKRATGVGTNGGVAPMNPANGLVGPIGGSPMAGLPGAINPATGQPMLTPMNGMAAQPDPNQGGGNGRRRGRRGGGGGGNFGGGGFGN